MSLKGKTLFISGGSRGIGLAIALRARPNACCLVPERREEVTTEGGLDAVGQHGLAGAGQGRHLPEMVDVQRAHHHHPGALAHPQILSFPWWAGSPA